jgi:hypothetical protein
MTSTERRHPANAQLREKIDRIQQISRELKTLVEQIQVQTVTSARQGQITDLPCKKFAHDVSPIFQRQRIATKQLQEQIKGTPSRAVFISDEERAALMM